MAFEEQITETIEAGAPSIKYQGDIQQQQQIAQQLWEQLPPEARAQFGSFEQFFSSGAWKKVLQALQQQMEQQVPQQGPQQMAQGPQPMAPQPQEGIGSMMPAQMANGGDVRLASHRGNDAFLEQRYEFYLEQGFSPREAAEQAHKDLMEGNFQQDMAYGGIAGADGRRQYGIGSWFQKKIMDPIKKNPLITAAVLGAGSTFLPGPTKGWISKALQGISGSNITKGLGNVLSDPKWMIPAASLVAGAFAKPQEQLGGGAMSRGAGINLQDIAKLGNITDEQQGQAIGLNFLPEASARKYSPEEMALTYSQAGKAHGGRIGAIEGGLLKKSIPKQHRTGKDGDYDYGDESLLSFPPTWIVPGYIAAILGANYKGKKAPPGDPTSPRGMRRTKKQEGGLMSLGGNEMDLRGGGFVPIGEYEKKDDVPARLSKNEFVFTADAVRAAGGGNVDAGADKMYNTMKQLEGRVG